MSNQSSPVIFGEVLFDCFPDGVSVLGGAPFNVAWHCQAFGLSPLLVSRVGNDSLGEKITTAMRDWGMDMSGLQQDVSHPTGVVDVRFNDGEPSYDIVENSAWDFIDVDQLPNVDGDGMLYHGSLALRSDASNAALQQLRRSGRSVFVDINLRPPWWQQQRVRQMIRNAQRLKLNEDELQQIAPQGLDVEQGMDYIINELSVEQLIVTRGERGVIAVEGDSKPLMVTPPEKTVVNDTVGAGDAFSSIMLLGQYQGWSLKDSLQRAQSFASAVVGIQGATINDRSFYEPFISAWKL